MLTEQIRRRLAKPYLLRNLLIAITLLTATSVQGHSQSKPDASQSFEVASVRPAPADHGYTSISPSGAAQFTANNVSMMVLVEMAYGVNGNQISASPSWFDSDLYDIAAKPEGDIGLSYEQMRPMLQQLLKQRFQLAVHREKKDVPGYVLVVAKSGPKLQAGKESSAGLYILQDGLQGPSMSMATLAGMLASPVGRPVIDKTGLTGNYDIKLSYAPVAADASTDSTLPSIFTAVQEQLGLKLEGQKVPVDFVVIDHAEKVPSDN